MATSNIMNSDFMTSGIRNFIEMLGTQPKLLKYKPYFEAMEPDLLRKCIATFKEYRAQPQDDALYILNHGDFHYKNMMFKHDLTDGKLLDVKLLDFQMCFVGPMVNDVIYACIMLMNREMRRNHQDELIYYFFSNFVETLQLIQYGGKIPKLIEFRQMLLRHKHWGKSPTGFPKKKYPFFVS